jgi:hypothetical protein
LHFSPRNAWQNPCGSCKPIGEPEAGGSSKGDKDKDKVIMAQRIKKKLTETVSNARRKVSDALFFARLMISID